MGRLIGGTSARFLTTDLDCFLTADLRRFTQIMIQILMKRNSRLKATTRMTLDDGFFL